MAQRPQVAIHLVVTDNDPIYTTFIYAKLQVWC